MLSSHVVTTNTHPEAALHDGLAGRPAGRVGLVADDLRVDVDDVPSCDGLTFRTTAERALVLGAPRSLFQATMGLRPVRRGALEIDGRPADEAQLAGRSAGVPLDPALPADWSPLAYVTWSARLLGIGRKDAEERAKAALARVELRAMAKARVGGLALHAKRATVLAAALATEAPIVLLEDPCDGLPEEVARGFASTVIGALSDRRWVLFAPRLALTSPFALAAEEALIASATRLEAQGSPTTVAGSARLWVARMSGPVEALAAALAARSVRLDVRGAQVHLDLGPEGFRTSDLLAACAATDVTVVELHPVQHALG